MEPTWQRVAQQLVREFSHGYQVARYIPGIGQGRNGDQGIVPDFVAAGHEGRTIQKIAVTVLKFRGWQADTEGKLLLHHPHPAFRSWFENKKHRGRH